MPTSREHDTYVSCRTETDGSILGTATCELCGPVSGAMYLDTHESLLRQLAAEHWSNSPVHPLDPAEGR